MQFHLAARGSHFILEKRICNKVLATFTEICENSATQQFPHVMCNDFDIPDGASVRRENDGAFGFAIPEALQTPLQFRPPSRARNGGRTRS
jgi:hypothetical protein